MSEPIKAVKLEDLGEFRIPVVIPRPDGQRISVEMRTLSEQEIWDIRRAVKWPEAPFDLQRVEGKVTKLYNYDDKKYQEAVTDANRELSCRMLLACLCLDIPGGTADERISNLQKGIGQYAFSLLLKASDRINIVTAEDVSAMLRSFRFNGSIGDASNAGLLSDAAPVAGADARGTGRDDSAALSD